MKMAPDGAAEEEKNTMDPSKSSPGTSEPDLPPKIEEDNGDNAETRTFYYNRPTLESHFEEIGAENLDLPPQEHSGPVRPYQCFSSVEEVLQKAKELYGIEFDSVQELGPLKPYFFTSDKSLFLFEDDDLTKTLYINVTGGNLALNIGQLKELLDEAFAYKNPKDREGKSKVFLDLLLEAESAEEAEGRHLRASERSGAGGSLQNISQAVDAESHHHTGGRRRNRHSKGPGSSVSARQREGGSLPCNVNTGWTADWQNEGVKRRDLTSMSCESGNTVQRGGVASALSGTQARRQTLTHSASNELPIASTSGTSSAAEKSSCEPPTYRFFEYLRDDPIGIRPISSCDMPDGKRMNEEPFKKLDNLEVSPEIMTQDDHVSSTTGPNVYYYEHIGYVRTAPSSSSDADNNNGNGQNLYRTSATLEVGDGFSEDGCIVNGVGAVELCDRYQCVQSVVGDGSTHQRRCSHKQNLIGVAVSQPSDTDPLSGKYGSSSSKKNNKRKQAAQRNVALSCRSEDMPGYRGDTDIDTVLSFIENDGKLKAMGLKKQFPKQKVQEKKQKNPQKASSLEELSQRNIEDLTQSSETDRHESRRLWSDQVYIRSESQNDISTRTTEETPLEEDNNDSEFQMVRKKQRRRRGVEQVIKRTRRRRSGTSCSQRSPRRKSASSVPPSDHSADSDLDSVHSLPATGRPVSRPLSRPASESVCDISLPTPAPPLTAPSALTTHDFPSLPSKPEVRPEMKSEPRYPEPKPETRFPELKTESRHPDTKPEPRHPEAKPEPRHPEVKPESRYPELKPEPRNPELKPEPRQPELKPEPRQPELKTEPRQPEVNPEPKQPEVKPEPRQPEVKPEPRQPELKPEPRQPEEKPEPRQPELKPEPRQPEEKPEPRHPEVKPESRYQEVNPEPRYQNVQTTSEPKHSDLKQDTKVEAKPDAKPKTRSKSVGPNTRPPVILLDGRRSQDAAACEFTFGFEVNMQLLSLTDNTDPPNAQDISPRKPNVPGEKARETVATQTTDHATKPSVVSAAVMTQTPEKPHFTPVAPKYTVPALRPTETLRKVADVRPHIPWKMNEALSSPRPPPPSSAPLPTSLLQLQQLQQNPPPAMASRYVWKIPHPSELPVRTYGSHQRPPPTPRPQPKPSMPADSFTKPVRPSTLPFPQPVNKDTHYNLSGDKMPKRFNTYIVTNHTGKKTHEASGSRVLPLRPVNDPPSGIQEFQQPASPVTMVPMVPVQTVAMVPVQTVAMAPVQTVAMVPVQTVAVVPATSGKSEFQGPASPVAVVQTLPVVPMVAMVPVQMVAVVPAATGKSEEPPKRRVSDVMTSTDDLETASATAPSKECPPVKEKPVQASGGVQEKKEGSGGKDKEDVEEKEVEVEEEEDEEEVDEDGEEEEEEGVEDEEEEEEEGEEEGAVGGENPHHPFANADHRNLVTFLQSKWDDAVNASDTVWYSED